MKNIILFGATGSVGVHTATTLAEKGYNVCAVGKRKSDNGFFADYGIKYYSVDISVKSQFEILPKNIDIVLHFAGAMPARMIGYDHYSYIDTIMTGTLNILEYMREVNAKKIIFTQSISDILYLFGSEKPILPDVERRFPLKGDHSVYSISKNAAVNLIEHYYAEYGIKRFILRLPTIYVYHPDPFYYVNGIKKWMGYRYLMDQAMRGNTMELWGDPESKKEIVYVKDFVQIVEKSIESDLNGGIYNVGTGVGVTMAEQIEGIVRIFSPSNKKSEIISKPDKPSSPQFILDITKTKELGYEPQYNYEKYLIDFKKEMDAEPFSKLWGRYSDFVKE